MEQQFLVTIQLSLGEIVLLTVLITMLITMLLYSAILFFFGKTILLEMELETQQKNFQRENKGKNPFIFSWEINGEELWIGVSSQEIMRRGANVDFILTMEAVEKFFISNEKEVWIDEGAANMYLCSFDIESDGEEILDFLNDLKKGERRIEVPKSLKKNIKRY